MTDAEKVVKALRERADDREAAVHGKTLSALADFVLAADALRAWTHAHGREHADYVRWADDRARYDAALARLREVIE